MYTRDLHLIAIISLYTYLVCFSVFFFVFVFLFFQCRLLHFCETAEISQCETLVGHGTTVSPLLSCRSKRVLNVTVTGEGFPHAGISKCQTCAGQRLSRLLAAARVCALSGQAEQMFSCLDKL